MASDTQKLVDELIHKPHGILLVTGPTGSGKTTTLYAALEQLNDNTQNIMTVEDPIEYYIDGIGQTQVNTKVEMTFARVVCARSCDRIRTWCWSAKSAIWRPRRLPCRRVSPAIW
jgi:type II secretory ATPase GspE/PulE/Tfp pilus assembly ATPase PilB-like protein